MALTEIIEAEGHLIDSHIMERIFDTVVEYQGRFEVEKFHIGRTNSESSQLRMRIETPTREQMDQLLSQLVMLGCVPVDAGDAVIETVTKDRCAPEDFYSTTNHRTLVRIGGEWIEASKQRMDATVVVDGKYVECRKLRDLMAGDQVVVGMRGIRVVPDTKDRERSSFSFMSNEVSSERQVETAVATTVAIMRAVREQAKKIVFVAGPVVVHTGGSGPLSELIRLGWVDALLAGNALAVHDIEAALLGTSLGIRQKDGRQEEHGHRNHMRAINAINHCGNIEGAVAQGKLTTGVMYECVKHKVPFVLAGSLRDDGPLPDTVTDMNEAQNLYTKHIENAGVVLCLSSMLHSIATGNMLPSWVKMVCVDINPAVATKVSDRGSSQTVGVVTDVGLFLDLLIRKLKEQ